MRILDLAEAQRLEAWRAWSDATQEQRDATVEDAARIQGWQGTLRTWRATVSRAFSPDCRKPLPAFLLLLLAKHTGRDCSTAFVMRALSMHRKRPLRARPREIALRDRA
jgi:hypothetical protein